MAILAQSSADFAFTYNFLGTHVIYRAHRAVVPAIAWHLVLLARITCCAIVNLSLMTLQYLTSFNLICIIILVDSCVIICGVKIIFLFLSH